VTSQHSLMQCAGVLAATVGVNNQSWRRLALRDS
jgi:hypothetical protein